jgi:hypothetical protein
MGPWGIALAILVGASFSEGGRRGMRKAAKEGIKAGMALREKASEMVAEIKEHGSDIVAEVRAEQAELALEKESEDSKDGKHSNGKKTAAAGH